MANSEQNTQAQGRAKARRTALVIGLAALAVYAGFLLAMAIN